MKTLFLVILFCLPVAAQSKQQLKPTWQGLYVGIARTAPFDRRWTSDQVRIEINAIIGIGKRGNIQAEALAPLTAQSRWLYRVQLGIRLF